MKVISVNGLSYDVARLENKSYDEDRKYQLKLVKNTFLDGCVTCMHKIIYNLAILGLLYVSKLNFEKKLMEYS